LALQIFIACAALVLVPVPLSLLFGLDGLGYHAIAFPVYGMFLVPFGGYLYCVLKPHTVYKSEDVENA